MCQARVCGRVLARGPTPRCSCLELNTACARSPLPKFEKNIVESAALENHACQCTDGHSAVRNGQQRVVLLLWANRTHVARLVATCLNYWVMSTYPSFEDQFVWLVSIYRRWCHHDGKCLVILRNLESLNQVFLRAELSFSDCSSSIWSLDKIYQNSWLQTIGHRLKLKKDSLLTILAQCSSNSSTASDSLRKVRTQNSESRTDLRDWVMDDLSVTQ